MGGLPSGEGVSGWADLLPNRLFISFAANDLRSEESRAVISPRERAAETSSSESGRMREKETKKEGKKKKKERKTESRPSVVKELATGAQ